MDIPQTDFLFIPKNQEYIYDEKITLDEQVVINKFLQSYKNQEIIVADIFRQDFSMVPLENKKMIFKTNENKLKYMNFCRRIYHNRNSYVVELGLYRTGDKNHFKCLRLDEFKIIANGKIHCISLNISDLIQSNILFNILSIFNEEKIISPEQAYCKQMYTDKELQKLITNHEWEKIDKGVKQTSSLTNALFIECESTRNSIANFGTILYQLILFRQNNKNDFNEKDLYKLDKLILKLSKTELLRVQLYEESDIKSVPTNSILLKSNNYSDKSHISKQYNVTNTGLDKEKRELAKCIKKFKV